MPENKCIHRCGHYHGADGNWYISCSACDCDKPSDECNEDCTDYETEGKDDRR